MSHIVIKWGPVASWLCAQQFWVYQWRVDHRSYRYRFVDGKRATCILYKSFTWSIRKHSIYSMQLMFWVILAARQQQFGGLSRRKFECSSVADFSYLSNLMTWCRASAFRIRLLLPRSHAGVRWNNWARSTLDLRATRANVMWCRLRYGSLLFIGIFRLSPGSGSGLLFIVTVVRHRIGWLLIYFRLVPPTCNIGCA